MMCGEIAVGARIDGGQLGQREPLATSAKVGGTPNVAEHLLVCQAWCGGQRGVGGSMACKCFAARGEDDQEADVSV